MFFAERIFLAEKSNFLKKMKAKCKSEKGCGGMVYRCYIKILIDIFVAVLSLIALMPVFGVIAVAIKWDSEGPVLFKQKRCGQYGRTFLIYKFRTMYKTAPYDRPVKELKNPEQYITRTGRVLRRTSLDELPQIFNMIKGEMSLIGPRPFLLAEGEVLAAREKAGITAVRPGITGLAQINGRNRISNDEKVVFDRKYVENICFLTDAAIFFKTIRYVIKRQDIYEGMLEEECQKLGQAPKTFRKWQEDNQ